MGFQIEDGVGKGKLVSVTHENKLRVYSTIEDEISFESEVNGRAYSWLNESYSYSAGDTVLWLRNDSTSENLILDTLVMWSDTTTEVVAHFPTGTTPTGTLITGINYNRKSGNTASATAYADETGNVQGDVWGRARISAGAEVLFPLKGVIILGKNDEIAFDFVTSGTACMVNVAGYYHTVA